jgi:hypothetical protein
VVSKRFGEVAGFVKGRVMSDKDQNENQDRDIESQLKNLQLRAPSPDLDHRVMRQRVAPPASPVSGGKRVPLWGALAAAVVLGVAGFWLGMLAGQRQPEPGKGPLPVVTTELVYGSAVFGNPFDFTVPSDEFPAGELEAELQIL